MAGYVYKGDQPFMRSVPSVPKPAPVKPAPVKPAPVKPAPVKPAPVPFVRRKPVLKPCGTEAAYKRHLDHNEYPCTECTDAHNDYLRAYRADPASFKRVLAPCGTLSAHDRHRVKKEPIDDACRRARNKYQQDLYARKKAAKP